MNDMNPFPPDIETQTATHVPNLSFKKKATSLEDLRKTSFEDSRRQSPSSSQPSSTNRSTPITSLSSPPPPDEPQAEPIIPSNKPSETETELERKEKEKETLENEEQQQNEIYGIGDQEVMDAHWVEVPENLFLLKAFPTLLPPDVGFPIVTFWMIVCICISFYGRHEWIRKLMITLLCIILYTIFKHWEVYLALWNEGNYSDPWFDSWITTSMFSTAQSPKEAKGILFSIFLCFMFILQIFLYFYV
jgi:hypothetical protein